MIKVIGERGTGKTRELLKSAYINGGTFVCADKYVMESKAKALGYYGIKFISYGEYLNEVSSASLKEDYYIDELEGLLKLINVVGFTLIGGNE